MKRKGSHISSGSTKPFLDAPQADEVEISLFGPSYGECVVIHAGDGVWFVVDSCTIPGTEKSRCVRYFEEIGVDVSTDVRRIIATHWDQDHIRGLSQLVELAKNAEFVCSAAFFSEEFITLIELYKQFQIGVGGGVKEFARTLEILLERRKKPFLAMEQMTIWNAFRDGKEAASLVALSPSSATIIEGHLNIGTLLQEAQLQNLRVTETSRNDRSVVLWLRAGNAIALLGSDLEETGAKDQGWSAVLLSTVERPKAQIFKVPHHGSITGHVDQVWSDLLVPQPPAIIAPWRRGAQALPTCSDIQRIQKETDQLYVTTIPQNKRKTRSATVERMIRSTARHVRLVDEYLGHVRLRAKLSSRNPAWTSALFNGARKIEGRMAKTFPGGQSVE